MTADPVLVQLGRQLLGLDAGLGIYRLVHLYEALLKAASQGTVRTILSVGSGGGLHEAVIARLHPDAVVIGVDLRAPYVDVTLDNVRFLQGDLTDPSFVASLPSADFIYSIECLEHITEDRAVVASMASLVRPGGALYLQVPFASDEELLNADFVKEQWELHEHVRPGYSEKALREIVAANSLAAEAVSGAFWFPMQPLVWFAMERFGVDTLRDYWPEFVTLALTDLRDAVPSARSQATAIKILATKLN